MKLKKFVIIGAISAMMTMGLTACGSKADNNSAADNTNAAETENSTDEASDTDATTGELKPIRIGCGDATSSILNDLATVAQLEGYFEEELNKVGFTLETYGFQGQGPEINAALMSGSLDVGNYAEFPAYTSKSSGANTTVVAITDAKYAYGVLAVSDDIKTVSDLEGKRVVVQQGTAIQYVWEQIVADSGIDDSNIEIINSNVVDGASLLQTGDADAIISAASALENYVNNGLGHLLEGVPDSVSSTTLLVFDNDFLAKYPEAAVAVNKALIRAYEAVSENPQILYDDIGTRYGENGAAIIEDTYTRDGSLDYLNPDFDEDFISDVTKAYNWALDNSLLTEEIDLDSFFDDSYYKQALEELGE
jgi:ABC-type nitrate/sulfonate/bicarbonate transport system substrate-binding protein